MTAAQNTLSFAEPTPKEHLGVLLYGPEGDGKSTGGASAPGPIIYCNADRPGAIRFARRRFPDKGLLELPIDGRRPLEELYVAIRNGEFPDVQTVVLDSLGRIYDVVLADIAKDDKHPTLPERGDTNTFIERYVLALLELPIHVVLVAHDNPVVTSGNEEAGTANIELFPFTGTNTPALSKKLMRAMDIVAYCGVREIPDGEDLPDSTAVDVDRRREYIAQLFPAKGRRAKETTGVLGDLQPLVLSSWVDQVREAYGITTAGKADTKETTSAKQKEAVK